MSLTNDELEQQLLQLADALAKMSEMTATAFEDRDKHIEALREKVEALESNMKSTSAVLSSPRFLYLYDKPSADGKTEPLDGYDLA